MGIEPGEIINVSAIKPPPAGSKRSWIKNTSTTSVLEAFDYLEQHNLQGFNCYVTVSALTRIPEPGRRARRELVVEHRTLLVDCDPAGDNGVRDARILLGRCVSALGGIPLVQTFSGRGCQALVRLDPPAAERARDILRWLAPLAHDLDAIVDPKTYDSPRLCRAPGFIHQKSGARAEVLEWGGGPTADWSELLGLLPEPGVKTRKRGGRREKIPQAVIPKATKREMAPLRRVIMEPTLWPADSHGRHELRLALTGMLYRRGLTDTQICAAIDHGSVQAAVDSTRRAIDQGRRATGQPTVIRLVGDRFVKSINDTIGELAKQQGFGEWTGTMPKRGMRGNKRRGQASGLPRLKRWGHCGRYSSAAMLHDVLRSGKNEVGYNRVLVCETPICDWCYPRFLVETALLARAALPKKVRFFYCHQSINHNPCVAPKTARVSVPRTDGTYEVWYMPSDDESADTLRRWSMHGVFKERTLQRDALIQMIVEAQLRWHYDLVMALEEEEEEDQTEAHLVRTEGLHLTQNSINATVRWPTRQEVRDSRKKALEEDPEFVEVPKSAISHHELYRTSDGELLDRGPHPYGIMGAIAKEIHIEAGGRPPPPPGYFARRAVAGFG